MKTGTIFVVYLCLVLAASGQTNNGESTLTAQEQASWKRVAASYPDVADEKSTTYSFLQAQIDEIMRQDHKFFDQTNWPEILVARYATQLQVLKTATVPNSIPVPQRAVEALNHGSVLTTTIQALQGSSKLTVLNGTDTAAVAKLIDPINGKKLISFSIRPHDSTGIVGVPTGSYRLVFAFGNTIYKDTDELTNPTGFAQFDNLFSFVTISDSDGTKFNSVDVTLNPVVGGNAKSSKISREEFEKW